jgi:hypothetical protein
MDDILKPSGLRAPSTAEMHELLVNLATRADVRRLQDKIESMEARLVKWIVGAFLSASALVYSVAKFLH